MQYIAENTLQDAEKNTVMIRNTRFRLTVNQTTLHL